MQKEHILSYLADIKGELVKKWDRENRSVWQLCKR